MSAERPTPVPDVRGLFTGILRSSKPIVVVIVGSKLITGITAVDPANAVPVIP